MMRSTLSVAPLLLTAVLAAHGQSAESPPPHIVFVLADDLGPGDVGCYGGTIAPTPNIDRMAEEGIRFKQYYAAAPICSPSRCGLITGQFPGMWRITSYLQTVAGNHACEQADFLDPAAPSLPRILHEAGYATAHFGKWHLGGGRDVVSPPKFAAYGYDESAGTWESPEPHPDITASDWIWSDKDNVKRWRRTEFFVDKTLDFLTRHKDQPCFVNLWLDDPHTPWIPRAGVPAKPEAMGNLKDVLIENDKQLGRLRAGLTALGIDKSTLLIFTSDNGPLPTFRGQRTAGLRGSKLSLYEGGIRMPFIACWPGMIPEGAENTSTVLAAVDVLPSLAKIGGAALPAGVAPDGENLSDALLGKSHPERTRPLFWEYGRDEEHFGFPKRTVDRSPNLAVRGGAWKLLVSADGEGAEFYDVVRDPSEKNNVLAEHPKVAARLKQAVLEWRRSLP